MTKPNFSIHLHEITIDCLDVARLRLVEHVT